MIFSTFYIRADIRICCFAFKKFPSSHMKTDRITRYAPNDEEPGKSSVYRNARNLSRPTIAVPGAGSARSLRPPLDLLHELARLQSRLMRLQVRIVEKESPQASLLESALLLTNFEIRLVFTRLRYPSIADPVSVEVPKSPLYLSKEFTPTDLMELIAALQISGAVRRIDGSPADLPTLVNVLSKSFNVRINNPEQCRHAVINRKLRLTRFLDLLRNHLIECSRR